jgi:hypothetical protein
VTTNAEGGRDRGADVEGAGAFLGDLLRDYIYRLAASGPLDITLSRITAGDYLFTGRFHDSDVAQGLADIAISVDGGTTFSNKATVTCSTGTEPTSVGTCSFVFSTDGSSSVVVRVTADTGDHLINGFEITAATGFSATVYGQWQQAYFTPDERADADVAGDQGDPDEDRMVNLYEFAVKQDPRVAGTTGAPQPDLTNGFFCIEYRQRVGGVGTTGIDYAADGVSYYAGYTPDLQVGEWVAGPTYVEPVGAPVDNGDGTETVTVRSVLPIETTPKQFLRQEVRRL